MDTNRTYNAKIESFVRLKKAAEKLIDEKTFNSNFAHWNQMFADWKRETKNSIRLYLTNDSDFQECFNKIQFETKIGTPPLFASTQDFSTYKRGLQAAIELIVEIIDYLNMEQNQQLPEDRENDSFEAIKNNINDIGNKALEQSIIDIEAFKLLLQDIREVTIKEIGINNPCIIKIEEIRSVYSLQNKSKPISSSTMRSKFLNELQILREIIDDISLAKDSNNQKKGMINKMEANNRVFIVHGHDQALCNEVELLLRKLGKEPIILKDQPNKSKTVIEKFECYASDIAFAIVLLTPDDIGGVKDNSDQLEQRPRQNVLFELGFFIGKLGRERACALKKGSIDFLSDYSGVIYIDYFDKESWQNKLIREMKAAGLEVDANKLH